MKSFLSVLILTILCALNILFFKKELNFSWNLLTIESIILSSILSLSGLYISLMPTNSGKVVSGRPNTATRLYHSIKNGILYSVLLIPFTLISALCHHVVLYSVIIALLIMSLYYLSYLIRILWLMIDAELKRIKP